MIRSIYFPPNNKPVRNIPVDQFTSCIAQPDGLLWVIMEGSKPSEIQSVLGDIFNFHPLTIEDCLSDGYQTPKIDDFGDYLFIIAHAIKPNVEINEDTVMELNLYLGANYVVSLTPETDMPPINKIWTLLEKDQRIHQGGSDFLCHAILDLLVDDYMPLLERMAAPRRRGAAQDQTNDDGERRCAGHAPMLRRPAGQHKRRRSERRARPAKRAGACQDWRRRLRRISFASPTR